MNSIYEPCNYYRVMGSRCMNENRLIRMNFGLDEVEKVCGLEVVHCVYNSIMIV